MKALRRVSRFLRSPNLTQVAGIGVVLAGAWWIYEPVALLLGGSALVAWAQGRRRDDGS
jgi:hypothetical protein